MTSRKSIDSLDSNNVDETIDSRNLPERVQREIAGNELTFESIQAFAQSGEIDVMSASALADQDGFIFMASERKHDLVGSKFYIVRAEGGFSKNYGEFVTLWIVTELGNKLKFVDFSTGVKRQIQDLLVTTEDGNPYGSSPAGIAVFCENGLSESTYDADPETGRPGGTTYYLDTSGGALPAGQL